MNTTFENEMSLSAACALGAVSPTPANAMPPATAATAARRAAEALRRCGAAANIEVINPHP
ncbi:hypothetical protein LIX60_03935 [Streptomyces sp. S07_1.15]|uniref:hypothetical protein n=1 Tax=Streptomyces sp. S07_1.15 TaxID=2873925 RepID=UPI001D14C73F|nr:hypothetical protein [Streptomyces sp. S07_1.15]MCC3650653.1 hypothetical protein [Streptomyces sp. S07_1.15]